MASIFQIILFGDETGDFRDPLRKLLERQHGLLFTRYIDRVNEALHNEVRHQPRHIRKQIPAFADLLDLVHQYQDSGSRNQILETTLTCMYQLGNVISFFDDHPSKYIIPSETVLVGLCTGLLAATAVSASQTALSLIDNALKIVRVAFRIGVRVNDAAQRLSSEVDHSWSRLVAGVQHEASISEVKQFNERKAFPKVNQAYVSSSSRDMVTISGPPATTKALFSESEYFCQHKTVVLDIYGPFHAPHLYNDVDIEEIVRPIMGTNVKLPSEITQVISGNEEAPPPEKDLDQLVRQAVGDIILRPLSFDRILASIVARAKDLGPEECAISSIGPFGAASSLLSTLRAETEIKVRAGEQFLRKEPANGESGTSPKIAIVGMSGRFPNADNLQSLWDLLEQGLDVHRRVPPDRFDVDRHFDPTGKRKNTSHTPYGNFIEEPGLFDPRFFNMSPREAYQTDPMGRLALVTAYEALEMSGFVPNRTTSSTTDRVGTFYGQSSDDWRQVNAAENVDAYYIPGNIRAFGPGRINYYFKFKGPSYNVDTACSSSFSAIQLACTSLKAKECDTALAGGLNIMTVPDLFSGLSRAQFLSKTGSCKTFDNDADGFCRGDGVATVVLKRLEDAEADNDPILGVILGTSTNHSSEAVSITQPHAPTQESLYRKILREAAVDARDISYVEMHGTGTQAGDGAEMRSISNVFAPRSNGRSPGQIVNVGALKANIGHGEASAGVSSLVKVLLMLQRNAIPPHVGIKGVINKTFPTDMEERGIRIAFKETPWLASSGSKRRAYLNNFSAAGGNTGLLLEDAPKSPHPKGGDPRTSFVVSVTAKSAWSLEMNAQKLISYLESYPNTSLPSLSYTTTARRVQQPFRISSAVSSTSEAIEALRSSQAEVTKPGPTKQSPKVAFVFTGQGAHYASLGKQLFEGSKQYRSDILDFDRIGRSQGFASFLPLLDGTITDATKFSPFVLQLGQTCIQMALARLWNSWGISASTVIGHSLGEYAALNVAGVLSVSDTIYLVGRRAQLLEQHCEAGTHSLLAVAASVIDTRKALVNDKPNIACINGVRETVVSGPKKDLISYSRTLKTAGIKSVLLPCAYAFHSAQVETIVEPFTAVASFINYANPTIPIISPLLKELVTGEGVIGSDYLARHVRETVDFLGGALAAREEGVVDHNTLWVEIGPSPVCSSFVKSSLGQDTVTVPTLHKKEDPWRTTSAGLSILHRKGLHIDWDEVHSEYESFHSVLALPSYTFENKNYWLEYHNNWCLTKGEVSEAPPDRRRDGRLSTSSVHKVTKQDYGDKITVIAESDLTDPDLSGAIFGHMVNGSALTPAGVYADMAMTLAGHIHKRVTKNSDFIPLDCRYLEITQPVILKDRQAKEAHLLRVTATADRPLNLVKFAYNSILRNGSDGDLHATCEVHFADTKSLLADWARKDYLFRSRIDVLNQGAAAGKYKKVNREKSYEDFSKFVQYGKKYRGMKEVIIDNKNFEASSIVEFQATDNDGDFDANPYWIDNIAHLSGFVLNGSDAVDSSKQVYISHGWESLLLARPLSGRKMYRNHVRMHQGPGKTMVGDVHVFDGDDMVALVGGVKFQAIPRSLLNKLLPPIDGPSPLKKAQNGPSISDIALPKKIKPIKVGKELVPVANGILPQTSVSTSSDNGNKVITGFMRIIAEELGMDLSDLHDGAVLTDVGLDSLMTLTVTGRLREELDVDTPSSLFVDKPTIGEAKYAILALRGADTSEDASQDVDAADESASSDSTPLTDGSSGGHMTRNTSIGTDLAKYPANDMIEKVLGIVAEEVGIDQLELTETSNFADIGVDSLMSLSITGRIREELDLDVPTTFFVDCPTVGEARIAIATLTGADTNGRATPSSYLESSSPIPEKSGQEDTEIPPNIPDQYDQDSCGSISASAGNDSLLRSATSVLLSGSPKTASKTLFLFPDGSGSATSYSLLPNISPEVSVYGLNCPFMKSPAKFTKGINSVADQYLAEIKRRQPQGPYYLGGWSAGGVVAYQVSYKLLEMGERTERLFLIDSPCPINLEPLPPSLLHFIDSLDLLGVQGTPPKWLIPHFEATIRNLAAFDPEPIKSHDAPKTLIILARDGLLEGPRDKRYPRSKGEKDSVKWILDSRRDIGTYGWEELLGDENIITMNVTGNHFTMIREPDVQQIANLLRRGMQ